MLLTIIYFFLSINYVFPDPMINEGILIPETRLKQLDKDQPKQIVTILSSTANQTQQNINQMVPKYWKKYLLDNHEYYSAYHCIGCPAMQSSTGQFDGCQYSTGEYMNICGECVGGRTEKDEDFGVDQCGICKGLDRCSSARTGCLSDIDEIDSGSQNCTVVMGLPPTAVDIAVTNTATFHFITAAPSNIQSTPNINCSLINATSHKQGEFDRINSTPNELKFKLLCNESKLDLQCSTEDFDFSDTVLVVDSRRLKPLALNVKEIELGIESKVTITVSNLFAPADLLCFAKMNSDIVYTSWSNDIEGNMLSSKVVCDNLWPKHAGLMNIGVAYSREAINVAETVEVNVVMVVPRVLEARIDQKKNTLTVLFSQNIPVTNNCSAIFVNTLSLGSGAICTPVANQIYVELGEESTLTPADLISVIVKSTNDVQQTDTIRIISASNRNAQAADERTNALEINGPSILCPNSIATFTISSQSQITNWSLTYSPNTAKKQAELSMSPGRKQRLNLTLWRTLREMRPTLPGTSANSIQINTSALLPELDYQLSATTETDGKQKEIKKLIRIQNKVNDMEILVKGPARVSWNSKPSYEAQLIHCSESLQSNSETLNYVWKMMHNNEDITATQIDGGRFFTADASLLPESNYNLSLQIYNGSKLMAQKSMDIESYIDDFRIQLPFDEAVFGTGHKITIDASIIGGFVPPTVNFKWLCLTSNGDLCLMPGKQRKFIDSLNTMSSDTLILEPGRLPVGRYTFTVKASLPSGHYTTAECTVIVTAGEPPRIALTERSLLSNTGQTLIKISISDIISECLIDLVCLNATGYTCPKENEITTLVNDRNIKGTPYDAKSTDIRLLLSEVKLNVKYKFRVNTDCGPLSGSHMIISVPSSGVQNDASLQIESTSGIAFVTNFRMQVIESEMDNEQQFTYSYGYQISTDKNLLYLITSLDKDVQLFAPTGKLKSIVKRCNMKGVCRLIMGSELDVSPASEYHLQTISAIAKSFVEQLKSLRYNEAIDIIKAVSITFNRTEYKSIFTNISVQVKNAVIEKINSFNERLAEDEQYVKSSVNLLDAVTTILEIVDSSDEIVEKIIEFRNNIQTAVKKKNNNKEKTFQKSSNMRREPRRTRSLNERNAVLNRARLKRDADPQILNEIKSYMKTTALAIQQYTKDDKKLQAEITALLQHLPGYMEEMCQTLGDTKPTMFIGTTVAEISSIKLRKSGNKQELKITECGDQCGNSTAQLILGKSLLDKFKDSDSICVGSSIFHDDFLSITTNVTSEENFGRWSDIYGVMMYKYNNSSVIKHELDTNSTKKPLGLIRIPLWTGSIPQGREIKCHSWFENLAWNWHGCKTAKQKMINNREIIECRCPMPGYFGLFAVSINDSSPVDGNSTVQKSFNMSSLNASTILTSPLNLTSLSTTSTQATPLKNMTSQNITATQASPLNITSKSNVSTTQITPLNMTSSRNITSSVNNSSSTTNLTISPGSTAVYSASFNINEKYDIKIGNKSEEFKKTIKEQLSEHLDISEPATLETSNSGDKIKVQLKLLEADLKNVSNILGNLAKALAKGDISLYDLDHNKLDVPIQQLEVTKKASESQSELAIIISVAILCVTIIVSILLVGQFIRKKREQRAIRFLQGLDSPTPKYLRLTETTSMDRFEQTYTADNQRGARELDSGVVLTVDANKMSSKYSNAGSSSNSFQNIPLK